MVQLFWLVLIPVITSIILLFLPLKPGKVVAIFVQGSLGIIGIFGFLFVRTNGEQIQSIGGWPQQVGILLRGELFSINMVLLSTLLFFFIFIYNWYKEYVDKTFLMLLLVFQGMVNGIFLSIDLFNIFVLVELSTVVISILIVYKQEKRSIYDGIVYMMTNIVAMSFFLFGLGILYKTTGVIDLLSLKVYIQNQGTATSLILPYAFIITGVSLKSALMPLFSWLPKAHGTPGAPTVVSAILSGLYVKCGVYLFYRIQQVFQPAIDTRELFLILGLITAVVGFLLAIAQKDIKLILAYHTVSQIGLIMTGMNMENLYANQGALYHIINHALFKATLFLTAGMLIDHYGTREVSRIRGVWREKPLLAAATLMAVLGITGAPLFNGSISKYWIGYGANDAWINNALFLVNLGTIISFVKYSGMLWGRPQSSAVRIRATPSEKLMTAVVLTMGVLCLLGGLLSEPLTQILFGASMPIIWAEYWQKALLFLLTLVAGVAIYYGILRRWSFLQKPKGFELTFNGISLSIGAFFMFIVVYLAIQYF